MTILAWFPKKKECPNNAAKISHALYAMHIKTDT